MQLLLQLLGLRMSAKAVGATRKASCLRQKLLLHKKRQELPSGIHRGLGRSFSSPARQEGDPLLLLAAPGSTKRGRMEQWRAQPRLLGVQKGAGAVRDYRLSVLLLKSEVLEVGRLRKEEERSGREQTA